jgi:EAL domain-containing protein (putative c-di-GMP-specific phosphodiesterase class I)
MTAMPASYTLRRPAAATRDRRAEIAAIISGQRFTLALQPVVAIASRAPDHAEALLRPAAPAALPLDAAVLHLARTAPPPLSVNVCARSLQQHDFVRTVLTLGAGAIELVRLDAIDDLAAVAAAVAELRAGGVRVALDEVDGGAASLALLQAARFDALKLAGSVVRGAMAGERGRRLLAQLLRLAQALGARPIATHIETLPQLWAAERAGIDLAQGWLLGAPAPWPGATATA